MHGGSAHPAETIHWSARKRNSAKFAKDGTIRSMRIISLNVGLPSAQRHEGRRVITSGAKNPVPRAVLRFGNFDGDRQADQLYHGGFEKAVCLYPFDHCTSQASCVRR
jgi:hypothetical protein